MGLLWPKSCDRRRAEYPTPSSPQLCGACLLQETVARHHAAGARIAHPGSLRQPATLPAPPPTSALNATRDQRSTLVPHLRPATACAIGRQPGATPGDPGLHGVTSGPRCATQKPPFPAPPPLPLAPLPSQCARGYYDDEGACPVAPQGHEETSPVSRPLPLVLARAAPHISKGSTCGTNANTGDEVEACGSAIVAAPTPLSPLHAFT